MLCIMVSTVDNHLIYMYGWNPYILQDIITMYTALYIYRNMYSHYIHFHILQYASIIYSYSMSFHPITTCLSQYFNPLNTSQGNSMFILSNMFWLPDPCFNYYMLLVVLQPTLDKRSKGNINLHTSKFYIL